MLSDADRYPVRQAKNREISHLPNRRALYTILPLHRQFGARAHASVSPSSPDQDWNMAVTIKTPEEIEKMRVAGQLAARTLQMIEEHVKPGVTTDELNRICHDYIVNELQAIPAPLNYRGFPKSICTSVNHVVCHGIPGERVLRRGDLLNIDVTVIKDGYHGDSSRMYFVGEPTILGKRLSDNAYECMRSEERRVGKEART